MLPLLVTQLPQRCLLHLQRPPLSRLAQGRLRATPALGPLATAISTTLSLFSLSIFHKVGKPLVPESGGVRDTLSHPQEQNNEAGRGRGAGARKAHGGPREVGLPSS